MSVLCAGKNICVSQKIEIKTEDGVYEGIVAVARNNRIVLNEVKSLTTNITYEGVQRFLSSEIIHAEILEDTEKPKKVQSPTSSSRTKQFVFNLKLKERQQIAGTFDDNETGNDGTKKKIWFDNMCMVMITDLDENFRAAINCLESNQIIGVSAEGLKVCLNGNFCWLQIDTSNAVFVFDMIENGKEFMENGLGHVLSSPKIIKVFHDCREISEVLGRLYDIKLQNVFDTQVADVIVYKMNNGNLPKFVRSLPNCLIDVFNLELSDVNCQTIRQGFEMEHQLIWQKRPLPLHLINDAIKNVVYLRRLRVELLKELNSELTRGTEIYLNSFKYGGMQTEEHILPKQFASMLRLNLKPRKHQKQSTMQFDENGFDINTIRNHDWRLRFQRDACHVDRETKMTSIIDNEEIFEVIQNAKGLDLQNEVENKKGGNSKTVNKKNRSRSASCSNSRRSKRNGVNRGSVGPKTAADANVKNIPRIQSQRGARTTAQSSKQTTVEKSNANNSQSSIRKDAVVKDKNGRMVRLC